MTSANSFKHQIELSVSIRCAAKRRVELCSKGIVRLTSGIQSSKSLHFYELVFLEGVPIGCPSGRKMLALNEHIARDLLGARQMLLEDNSKFVLFRYQPHHMDSALIRSILSNGIFSEKAPVAVTSFYSKFGYQFDHDSRSLSKMLESLLYVYYIEVKELIEQLDFPYSPMAVEVKKYLKQYARDYGFKNVANLIRHLHKSPIEKHMETCEFLVKHLYLPKHAQNVFVVDSTFYYAVEDLSSILSMSKTF